MSKRELRSSFEDFVRVRKTNIALIDTVDQSALETIPLGFNNNVYWHTGHLVTVQASLLYGRAGEPLPIDERFRKYFAKGTSPKDFDKARPTFDLICYHLSISANHSFWGHLPYALKVYSADFADQHFWHLLGQIVYLKGQTVWPVFFHHYYYG